MMGKALNLRSYNSNFSAKFSRKLAVWREREAETKRSEETWISICSSLRSSSLIWFWAAWNLDFSCRKTWKGRRSEASADGRSVWCYGGLSPPGTTTLCSAAPLSPDLHTDPWTLSAQSFQHPSSLRDARKTQHTETTSLFPTQKEDV